MNRLSTTLAALLIALTACQTIPRCKLLWSAERWGPRAINLTALLLAAPDWSKHNGTQQDNTLKVESGKQLACRMEGAASCYSWPADTDGKCLFHNASSCLVVKKFQFGNETNGVHIVLVVQANQTWVPGVACVKLDHCKTEAHVATTGGKVELYYRTALGPSNHPKICQRIMVGNPPSPYWPTLVWSKTAIMTAAGLGAHRGIGLFLAKRALTLGTVGGDLSHTGAFVWDSDMPNITTVRKSFISALPQGTDWRKNGTRCIKESDVCANPTALNGILYNWQVGFASWGKTYSWGEPPYKKMMPMNSIITAKQARYNTCLNTSAGMNPACARPVQWKAVYPLCMWNQCTSGGHIYYCPTHLSYAETLSPASNPACSRTLPAAGAISYYVTYTRNPKWDGQYPWFKSQVPEKPGACVLRDYNRQWVRITRTWGICTRVVHNQPIAAPVGIPYNVTKSKGKNFLTLIEDRWNRTALLTVHEPKLKISSEQTAQRTLVYNGFEEVEEQAMKFLRKSQLVVNCTSPGATVPVRTANASASKKKQAA